MEKITEKSLCAVHHNFHLSGPASYWLQWLLLREVDLSSNSLCLPVFLDLGVVVFPVISILSGSKKSN